MSPYPLYLISLLSLLFPTLPLSPFILPLSVFFLLPSSFYPSFSYFSFSYYFPLHPFNQSFVSFLFPLYTYLPCHFPFLLPFFPLSPCSPTLSYFFLPSFPLISFLSPFFLPFYNGTFHGLSPFHPFSGPRLPRFLTHMRFFTRSQRHPSAAIFPIHLSRFSLTSSSLLFFFTQPLPYLSLLLLLLRKSMEHLSYMCKGGVGFFI